MCRSSGVVIRACSSCGLDWVSTNPAHVGPQAQADIQQSLTTWREKLLKIGATVVSHGRYVTFQLAEVAVPRELFQKFSASSMGCGRLLCRHHGGPSSSIQVARQDRCVRRAPGYALTARKGRWPGIRSPNRLDKEGRSIYRLPDQDRTRIRASYLLHYR